MASDDAVYVPIIPSLDGFFKELNKGTKSAGESAGKNISAGLEKALAQAEKAADRTGDQLERANNRAKDAADRASLAQQKLVEVMGKENAKVSEIAKARMQYESAVRKQQESEKAAARAAKNNADALNDVKRAAQESSDAIEVNTKELRKGEDAAKDFSKATDSIGGSIKFGAIAGIFSSITSQITGSLAGFTSEALTASDATDKFKATLNFAGLEAGAIDNATAKAQAYADATVYGLSDIQSMMAQLAANGVKDYVGLAEAAGNLNAVAGGNAETFKSVGMAMSQTAGAGKLTTENFNQIANVIPGASGKIQEALLSAGAYTGDFRKAMADGQITAEEFNKAVMQLGSEPVAQEAAKSTSTFEGMIGNLQATIEGGLTGALNELKPEIGAVMDGISDFATVAMPKLVDWTKEAISTVKELSDWGRSNSDWLIPLGVGIGALAGSIGAVATAMKIWSAASAIYSTVTKIATGETLLFNMSLKTNVIIAVVSALVALVAGLTYFFTKTETGKRMWGEFMDSLGVAWTWLKDTFTPIFQWVGDKAQAAWSGIKAGWDALSAGFMSAWHGFIKPVFDGMVLGGKLLFAVIATAVIAPLLIAWNHLSSTFKMAWENIIKPAWDGMSAGALWLWNNALLPAFDGIKAGWQLLVDGIKWAWETLLKPAWDAIAMAANWLWQNILVPAFDGMKLAWNLLVDGIKWYWENVLKPVWSALETAANWLWNNVFVPVTDGIKSAWSIMGDGIRWVNDNVIQPVFNGIQTAVDLVKKAFDMAVDGIGKAWDGLREKTAGPVRFIVDTVYNNGIRKAWNAVSKLVGLDELPEHVAGFARGGILPGFSRMSDGDDQLAMMRRGEGVMVSEGLQDKRSRDLFLSANEAAKRGVSFAKFFGAYAGGGIIDSISAIVAEKFPMMTITSTYRAGDPGHHGAGKAVDFSNGFDTTPEMQQAAAYFAENYGSELLELIHSPFGENIKNGQSVGDGFGFYGAGTMDAHRNHVHVAADGPLAGGKGGVLGLFSGVKNYIGDKLKSGWDSVINKVMDGAPQFPGIIGGLPGKVFDTLKDKAWEFIKGKAPASSAAGAFVGDPGAGVEQWRGLVESVLKAKGHPVELTDTVLRRMNQESGGNAAAINDWDINAINGTPSKGLMQVIDPTFQTHKDPGFDDIWDPESNIRASMNYAMKQYGSLPAAYNRAGGYALGGIVGSPMLYDQGGWVEPGLNLIDNRTGKPEAMFNPADSASLRSLPDVAKAVNELVTAFHGGDWGYGELEQFFGPRFASHMVNETAKFGEFFRNNPEIQDSLDALHSDALDTAKEWGGFGLGMFGLDPLLDLKVGPNGGRMLNGLGHMANDGLAANGIDYRFHTTPIEDAIVATPSVETPPVADTVADSVAAATSQASESTAAKIVQINTTGGDFVHVDDVKQLIEDEFNARVELNGRPRPAATVGGVPL